MGPGAEQRPGWLQPQELKPIGHPKRVVPESWRIALGVLVITGGIQGARPPAVSAGLLPSFPDAGEETNVTLEYEDEVGKNQTELVLERVGEVIKGTIPGTEMVLQKTPDSPFTPPEDPVPRPSDVAKVADVYTQGRSGQVNLISPFEGNSNPAISTKAFSGVTLIVPGQDTRVGFKHLIIPDGNSWFAYIAPDNWGVADLVYSSEETKQFVNGELSEVVGELIARAGGYPANGNVPPEARALGGSNPAIIFFS